MKLLVIDDTPAYLEVAAAALGEYEISFVSSYEAAAQAIESEKFHGVISDLFFPSNTDWAEFVRTNLTTLSEYKTDERSSLREKLSITENPAGLGIALLCKSRGIPFIIITDGSRHKGNFGELRNALIATGFITGGWDPLPKLVLYGNGQDKTRPEPWRTSLDHFVKF